MSFLDNLENSLKSLENEADREGNTRDQERRKSERDARVAAAPWAEQLKTSAFTEQLLRAAVREGYQRRVKVYTTWIGDSLRFEARERRLELHPEADGVRALYLKNKSATGSHALDLQSDPDSLMRNWLASDD